MTRQPTYIVADAFDWLAQHQDVGAVITGPADAAEIGMDLAEYPAWLAHAATLCLRATSPDAPTIFAVTDRKTDGGILSKPSVIMQAAVEVGGRRLLWHKISLRRDPGKIDLHRPGYMHVMAFSERATAGKATPDVLPPGKRLYPNAHDSRTALMAIRFAARHTRHVVDPFCGRGTIPALAVAEGLEATGVDIDPAQIERAKRLRIKRSTAASATPAGGVS